MVGGPAHTAPTREDEKMPVRMSNEYEVGDGITLHHHRPDDWYVTVDAAHWVEHYLMCNDECAVEVGDGTQDEFCAPYRGCSYRGDIGIADCLDALVKRNDGSCAGPYSEGDYFDAFTGNSENSFDRDMLIIAAHVDLTTGAWMERDNPLVRALMGYWHGLGLDVDQMRGYVVAIGECDAYSANSTIMSVYVDPNMDDDYDVAQWNLDGYSHLTNLYVDGPNGPYPFERLPMYDVSACDWSYGKDVGNDGAVEHQTVDGWEPWPDENEYLMVGAEGVWHIQRGEDGAWAWGPVWWRV